MERSCVYVLVLCRVVRDAGFGQLKGLRARPARSVGCLRRFWFRWRRPAARVPAPGNARDRSKPPRMPAAASSSSTGATGRPSFSTTSWKCAPSKTSRTRRRFRAAPRAACAVFGMLAVATLRQTLGPEQRHVDRRRRHQQALVGADVRGRLGAADVLLARLQRQREAGLAVEVHGAADDAARHLAHEFLLGAVRKPK